MWDCDAAGDICDELRAEMSEPSVDTAGIKGTDSGTVFASMLFVSFPIEISVTAIGLLSVDRFACQWFRQAPDDPAGVRATHYFAALKTSPRRAGGA
jgi:hypothetical protein